MKLNKWQDCNRHSIFRHPGLPPILVFLGVWCILIACGVGFCCEQCQFLAAHGRPTMNMETPGIVYLKNIRGLTASPTATPATHFNHISSTGFQTPQFTAKATPTPLAVKCPNIPNFAPGKKVTIGGYTGVTVFTTTHCPALLVLIPIKEQMIDHTKANQLPEVTQTPHARGSH